MGIDAHALNFVYYNLDRAPLGRVITIGRQSLERAAVEGLYEKLGIRLEATVCEPALLAFGATTVESLDVSPFEQATRIADLNKAFELNERYNTVIDAGSLEHIFNVSTAFENLIRLCEIGGRIFHVLPVNNLNGHGFWQFSSDLMYTI